MDFSNILSLLIALAAVIVPFFINWQNNRHALKLKKLEMIYAQKSEAYKDFADNFFALKSNHNTVDDYDRFYRAAGTAMLLCDNASREFIQKLSDSIHADHPSIYFTDSMKKDYENCIVALSSELNKLINR